MARTLTAVRDAMRELLRLTPPELSTSAGERWIELSRQEAVVAAGSRPTEMNDELGRAARDDADAPTAPVYLLWAAENLIRQGQHHDAVDALDEVATVAASSGRLLPDLDVGGVALHHRAQSAVRAGALDVAVEAFGRLAEGSAEPAAARFEAGLALEEAGEVRAATEQYRSAAGAGTPSSAADDPAELARRALQRLDEDAARFAPDVDAAVVALAEALGSNDAGRVRELASRTHLASGPAGGHLQFETSDVLDLLSDDLADSDVEVGAGLRGSGDKRYLLTRGWRGSWFIGEVGFVLTRSPRGWQWTGIAITRPTEDWAARWQPEERPTAIHAESTAAALALRAPWPAGQYFTAGGFHEFLIQAGSVAAAGIVGGAILAAGFATSRCGWGTRGYYYNEGPTHAGSSGFAIDFTRYRRYVPFDNESGGTPVLAPAAGMVVTACGGRSSGDSSAPNIVEVMHPDPETGKDRFLTRYLHLAGPWKLPVSTGMAVRVGERLGLIDDTGTSVVNHLHFSLHDQDQPFPGAGRGCGGVTRGTSIPPSPLDGVTLGGGDSDTCMRSSNVEDAGLRTTDGRIAMLRAHDLGTGFGPDHDHLDGEVVVELDTSSNEWFGYRLRGDDDLPHAQAMLATLRTALLADEPVRIGYVQQGASVRRIVHVERSESAAVEAVAGAVTMLRVHELGTGYGPSDDHLDAEVVLALDTRPDERFGFRLRTDPRLPAAWAMLAAARSALIQQTPVTLEYVRTGPTVRRVLRVIAAP